jgi:DNA-binding NarL/FixJ family response regulator
VAFLTFYVASTICPLFTGHLCLPASRANSAPNTSTVGSCGGPCIARVDDPRTPQKGWVAGRYAIEGVYTRRGASKNRRTSSLGPLVHRMTAPQKVISVLLVDDHSLFREGIAALIASQPDMRVIGEAASGTEALERFRSAPADVTLMDLKMPGLSGTEAIVAIRAEFPDAKIIALTTYSGDVLVQRALVAGARGYLLKGLAFGDLAQGIRDVARGLKAVQPELMAGLAEHATAKGLTNRELDVIQAMAQGNSNRRIAKALSINEATVKGHVKRILAKLGARDRTHAVVVALQRGLIEP